MKKSGKTFFKGKETKKNKPRPVISSQNLPAMGAAFENIVGIAVALIKRGIQIRIEQNKKQCCER